MLSFEQEEESYVRVGPTLDPIVESVKRELQALGREFEIDSMLDSRVKSVMDQLEEMRERQRVRDEMRNSILCPICHEDARICPWARERLAELIAAAERRGDL